MPNCKTSRLRHFSLLSVWTVLLVVGGSRSGTAAENTNLSKMVKVDIAAQKLSPALIQFSQQASVQILTPANSVDNLTTQGVHGEMSLRDALTRLLDGTPLSFHWAGENAIGIRIAVTESDNRSGNVPAQEGKEDSSGGFRVAQVDQGKGSGASPVGNQTSNSLENSNSLSTALSVIVVTAHKRVER